MTSFEIDCSAFLFFDILLRRYGAQLHHHDTSNSLGPYCDFGRRLCGYSSPIPAVER
jgi:hypothetical protein